MVPKGVAIEKANMGGNEIPERRNLMECPKCGMKNPEHVAFCGKCGQELPLRPLVLDEPPLNRVEKETPVETGPTTLQAQVSIAINTRRIALVLILTVLLSIFSTLLGLWISIFEPDTGTTKTIFTIWLILASIIMMGGLTYVILTKRLTRLSSH
jgi:hypothetical protein